MHSLELFHGDIKPDNIFYNQNTITTDIGSAVDMTDPDPNGSFYVTTFTPLYASEKLTRGTKPAKLSKDELY